MSFLYFVISCNSETLLTLDCIPSVKPVRGSNQMPFSFKVFPFLAFWTPPAFRPCLFFTGFCEGSTFSRHKFDYDVDGVLVSLEDSDDVAKNLSLSSATQSLSVSSWISILPSLAVSSKLSMTLLSDLQGKSKRY